MRKTPVLYVDWFDDDDGHDATSISEELPQDAFEVIDASPDEAGKKSILDGISKWATNNPDAQFVIISSHGNDNEIGPANDPVSLTYAEIYSAMTSAKKLCNHHLDLMILGCETANAAVVFEATHGDDNTQPVVSTFVGFDGKPKPSEVRELLLTISKNMANLNPDLYVASLSSLTGGTPKRFDFEYRNGKPHFYEK